MRIPTTEQPNPRSSDVDLLSAIQFVELMNSEDALVPPAVAAEKQSIAQAIELAAQTIRSGGRLFYLGAGTSGRLGVLDASECPPTFNTLPDMVVGIIAGGFPALTQAIEGAEDEREQAALDLQSHHFSGDDLLVGIASSGRTPYVLGGLQYAKQLGAKTIGIACNRATEMNAHVDISIVPIVGPEVISGSTRLKAGTATKLVLNILSTGAMVLLGKTYGNRMVDLRATNTKLKARAVHIVSDITGIPHAEASELLTHSAGEVKTAVMMHLMGVSAQAARELLQAADGQLRQALCARESHRITLKDGQ